MDCTEVKDLLDAYSLGAAEPDEASALEEHVADCVRCWSSLNEAQRTAAMLALGTAMENAPESLRQRVLAEAARHEGAPLTDRLARMVRGLWPVGAGVVAAGAAASLVFAAFLNTEVNDLRNDNDDLVAQVETADRVLSQQRQLMALLAAPDVQQVELIADDPSLPTVGVYHWSESISTGALVCNDLPPAGEGMTYNVWLLTPEGAQGVGSFRSWDGIGQMVLDLATAPEGAFAIALSLDPLDADEPTRLFLRGDLER